MELHKFEAMLILIIPQVIELIARMVFRGRTNSIERIL